MYLISSIGEISHIPVLSSCADDIHKEQPWHWATFPRQDLPVNRISARARGCGDNSCQQFSAISPFNIHLLYSVLYCAELCCTVLAVSGSSWKCEMWRTIQLFSGVRTVNSEQLETGSSDTWYSAQLTFLVGIIPTGSGKSYLYHEWTFSSQTPISRSVH